MLCKLLYGVQPVSLELLRYEPSHADIYLIIGCDQLAAIEENIVTAFSEVGSEDNNRITVILNRAYKVSIYVNKMLIHYIH